MAAEIRPILHYPRVLPEPQAPLLEQRPLSCQVSLAMELTQQLYNDVRLLPQTQRFLAQLPGGQPVEDW